MSFDNRSSRLFVLTVGLLVTQGCEPKEPNSDIEAPIVTENAPMTSEEAAARSEPPPPKPRSR